MKQGAIERELSYSSCVNRSFLKRESEGSESDHGFDFEKAEDFFKKLRNPSHHKIAEKAIKKLLEHLSANSSSRFETLRLYLILPCCLYVDTNVYNDEIVSSVANLLLDLDNEERVLLGKWLKSISRKYFKRYVWFFKLCMTRALKRLHKVQNDSVIKKLFQLSKEKTALIKCTVTLDMLNEINLYRCKPIPFEKFYLNELIDKINIEGDFILLMQDRVKKESFMFRFCKYPFLYNSASKFLLLKCQCGHIMESHKPQDVVQMLFLLTSGRTFFEIRRDHPVEDARIILSKEERVLRQKLNVFFKDETQYTGDGIRQEFFQVLFEKLLDPDFDVFYYDEDSKLQWFKKDSNLTDVYFIGLMCGLAVYNGITLHLQFPLALYKKLLNRPVTFKDLFELKPMNYRSLAQLLDYEFDEFEALCLDFTVPHLTKNNEWVELCPKGADKPVTQSNREEYINKVTDYYLNTSIAEQFESFYKGFYAGIPENLLSSFHPKELKDVLVGNERCDFKEFEKVTEYCGEFTKNHKTIKLFWEVFHDMELNDQKAFLAFLTGTCQIPAYGLQRLQMTVVPRGDHGENPDQFLPRAMTCFNQLQLPRYTNKESMKEKMLCAIRCYLGFGLPL